MKAATTSLVCCVGALLSLSFVMLYSAGLLKGGAHFLVMQLVWAGAGFILAASLAAVDYSWLRKVCWLFLAITVVLLVLVLLTPKIKGASRWFKLGPANFQPSELGKLVLIIVLAHYGDK